MIPSGNHVGFIKLLLEQLNKKRLNNRFSAIGCQTPIAEFFYVYDGDGNIVRSIDTTSKKEYNYEYEEGRIVRATAADMFYDKSSGAIFILKKGAKAAAAIATHYFMK